MKDRVDIGTLLVDSKMQGIFHGRTVNTHNGAIRTDLHDVFSAEISLVHTAGGEPDRTAFVADGKIAARSHRHIVIIDTIHQHHDLIRRMKHFEVHTNPSYFIIYAFSDRMIY